MLTKFFSFHNKGVAHFSPHDEKHDLRTFYIVQHPQVADAEFEFGEWVRP